MKPSEIKALMAENNMNFREAQAVREQLAPQLMLVNYTEDQAGQDIRDEDVVHPFNHLYVGYASPPEL